MMNNNPHSIEYVVGIDFGHGETSAALCAMEWENNAGKLSNPVDLDILPGKKVVVSAIGEKEKGGYVTGEDVFNSSEKILSRWICFKKRPTRIDGQDERLMIAFMQDIYCKIKERKKELRDGNHLVYIACPSGWTEGREVYKQMAKKAGIPLGGMFSESRAAFLCAQSDTTKGMARYVSQGALICDLGSSTLDLTYLSDELKRPIDYGYDAGASAVEELLFEDARAGKNEVETLLSQRSEARTILLFETRMIKEGFYQNPGNCLKKSISFDELLFVPELPDDLAKGRLRFNYTPEQIRDLLEQGGYIPRLEQALMDFREKKIPDKKVYAALLTGGASRMAFLAELVKKVWGLDDNSCFNDSESASFIVSRGLALAARADLRTGELHGKLEEKKKELLSEDAVNKYLESFFKDLIQTMALDVYSIILKTAESFKNSPVNASIADFEQKALSDVKNELPRNMQTYSREIFRKIVSEAIEKANAEIEGIVCFYASSRSVTIQADIQTSVSESLDPTKDLNLDSVMDNLLPELIDIAGGIVGGIVGGALGAVAGLLLGALFWPLALIGALVVAVGGGTKSDADKKKEPLDADQRKQVYNKIGEEKGKIVANMEGSIAEALGKSAEDKIIPSLQKAFRESLESCIDKNIELAKRMLI